MKKVRPYDLEDRTLLFSQEVIQLVKLLPKNQINFRLCDQLIRSATSVGANLREANEALGRKDFFMRVRLSRKEAKETQYWLQLILGSNPEQFEINEFIQEATELRKILSSIIDASNKPKD